MTNPIKNIISNPENSIQSMDVIHKHLEKFTENAAVELGCTGASVVILGITMTCLELTEVNAAATSKMLLALSVMCDPKSNDAKKARAEKKRAFAIKSIFGSIDLAMADTAGNV